MQAPQLHADPVGKALDTLSAINQLDYLQLQKANALQEHNKLTEEIRRLSHDNDVYSTRKNLAHDDPALMKTIYGARDVLGVPKDINTFWELMQWMLGFAKKKEVKEVNVKADVRADRGDAIRDSSSQQGAHRFEGADGVMHYLDTESGEYYHYEGKTKIYDDVYAPEYY